MRWSIPIVLIILAVACSNETEQVPASHVLSRPVIRIIEASSPLYLDNILTTEGGSTPSWKLDLALQGVIADFYFNQCPGDSNETFCRMADALLFTVKIPGHSGDYYLMVMQHVPQGFVTGRLVSWDARKETITGGPVDIRFSGMYNVRNGVLEHSNLKKQFKITGPELIIKDTLGREAVVVRRLWHNGTFNSMERTVLSLDEGRVDTLFSSLSPFGVAATPR
jgi:hypothetical protein